jgi:hypothetical protein
MTATAITNQITARYLRSGQCVMLAGMVMRFSHWQGPTPVFYHFAGSVGKKQPPVFYLNHNLNEDSILETA